MPEQQQDREKLQKLEASAKDLQELRTALLNMLEDTEEARRQADEDRKKLELIIKNLSDGLLVFDASWNLELLNPKAEQLFGVLHDEVVGANFEKLGKAGQFASLVALLSNAKEYLFRKEMSIDERAVVEVTTSPFHEQRGELSTLVMLHDITREREMEQTKTEFVSLAAHQLRTPLAAIKWSVQMLLGGDAGEISKEQQTFLDKMSQSTERMIRLINDLLNITRIEEGRYLYQPTFQELPQIVKTMVQSYQDLAAQKGIKLQEEVASGKVPRVLVDEEKIRLAVQNLIENAIHYTPRGGEVTVRVLHDTKEVKLEVADTGMGIPEQQKKRVFEKFFRASNAKTVDTEGSGLGLYLVNNIITAHGGKVWFESEEGKGTTFTFTLPVREEISEFLKKF